MADSDVAAGDRHDYLQKLASPIPIPQALGGGAAGALTGSADTSGDETPPGERAARAAAGLALGVVGGRRLVRTLEDRSAPFFSALRQTIEQKMPNRASASQIMGILRGSAVKPDEVKWTSLEELFNVAGDRPLTKEEVLRWLDEHAVQVEERVYESRIPTEADIAALREKAITTLVEGFGAPSREAAARFVDRVARGRISTGPFSFRFAEEVARVLGPKAPGMLTPEMTALREVLISLRSAIDNRKFGHRVGWTKYEEYTLPGSERYREILITLPDAPSREEIRRMRRVGWADNALDDPRAAELRRRVRLAEIRRYYGPHWDEGDVVVHLRVTDRALPDGRRVLFLEEVQSDWHQQGREQGYMRPGPELERDIDELTALEDRLQSRMREWLRGGLDVARAAEVGREIDELHEQYRALEAKIRRWRGIPEGPFAKTWTDLALKRVLRMAAEEGFDLVGWTTGKQQVRRYWGAMGLWDAEGSSHRGMKAFYDEILPSTMGRLAKRWGGTVTQVEIPVPTGMREGRKGQVAHERVWAVDVTPAMRESVVREGQPLFTAAPLGGAVGAAAGSAAGARSASRMSWTR